MIKKKKSLMKSKEKIWEREIAYAQKPEYWQAFSTELDSCADMLLRSFEAILPGRTIDPKEFKAFFAPKFVRMLWGFSLENLLKGLLLSGEKGVKYIKGGKISWGKRGHDLGYLMKELGYMPEFPEKWKNFAEKDNSPITPDFYVEAWTISAIWFGKYPFPLGQNGLLDEYKSLASSRELLERSARGEREFILHDLMHQGIGDMENDLYERIKNDLKEMMIE